MREGLLLVGCAEAWSSVAVALAFAWVCFRKVTTRVDCGREGLWKTVIMSLAPCCAGEVSGGLLDGLE